MINKFTILKLILFFGLLDTFSILLLILLYLTGKDFLFLVNINFLVIFSLISIGSFGKIKFNNIIKFFIFILLISIVKFFLVIFNNEIIIYYIFTYFYSLLLSLFSFIFISRFNTSDYAEILKYFQKFAYYYLVLASIFLILYSFLYFTGRIAYFGMGSNLHIILPFFIKNGIGIGMFFLVIIVLSGKRAVLVNFLIQYIVYYLYIFRDKKFIIVFFLLLVITLISILGIYTNIFYRFSGIWNVDFNDSYSTLVAFGGRYEEVKGILIFYFDNNFKIFFGSYPGEYYRFVLESINYYGIISNTYDEPKNYTHVTIFSYFFRYGILVTSFIIIYLLYILVKYFNPKNEFYLVFVGILSSSFFGANLLTEPISWILIALFFKYKGVGIVK